MDMNVLLSVDWLLLCSLHDYDNNERLDGLEMMSAILHVLPDDEELNLVNKDVRFLSQEEGSRLHEARLRYQSSMRYFSG